MFRESKGSTGRLYRSILSMSLNGSLMLFFLFSLTCLFASPAFSQHVEVVQGALDVAACSQEDAPHEKPSAAPCAMARVFEGSFDHRKGGEAGESTLRMPSSTFSSREEPEHRVGPLGTSKGSSKRGGSKATFGSDIHVRGWNPESTEKDQTMATDRDGNFFLAFNDDYLSKECIHIYWSNDGGEHWLFYRTISNTYADLKEPSLAIGTGAHDRLLVAYIVDDGVNAPYPEVASAALHSGTFTYQSIPIWAFEGYAKPVIWTDSLTYSPWHAYLTCEGIFDSAADNINVCTWRSEDNGMFWNNGTVLLGNYDAYAWCEPDGSFGTSYNRLFITSCNYTDETIYCVRTANQVGAWQTPVAVYTLDWLPTWPVNPEVEAAVDYNNVLICATKTFGSNANIGTSWSTNAGDSWGYMYSLSGYTAWEEWAPDLIANPHGNSWHLTYTSMDGNVYYSKAPQNMSSYFQPYPDVVNDAGSLEVRDYTKKGIASVWETDAVGITWADHRDATPLTDADTYFSHPPDSSRIYVPEDYSTIQAAINASSHGQSIHVNAGTYYERIVFNGKQVRLRGTFGPEDTTIDGSTLGRVVTFEDNEGYFSILQGFTIRNGRSSQGGGILCDGSLPMIIDNVIKDNVSETHGGGIYCTYGSVPKIFNNLILDNSALNSYGGGIYGYQADPLIIGNVIAGNTAYYRGGGIHLYDSEGLVVSNTIADNNASLRGGGINTEGSHGPQVRNTILWDNAALSGAQIYDISGGVLVRNCNVKGGWSGQGNINVEPSFYDPSDDDYSLTRLSPCINVGSSANAISVDILGNGRPCMGTFDIGAYEYSYTHCLNADRFEIDESAGSVIEFTLSALPNNKYRTYMIFAGVTGNVPGTPLPNSTAVLPLNWDIFTDTLLTMVNTPAFANFMGSLNSSGYATATLNTYGPLPPGSSGTTISFAFALSYKYPLGWFASNPLNILIVP